MAKLVKKTKEAKVNDIKKCEQYLEKYDTVVFIENNDIQNTCLQSLRSLISGKIMVLKKTLFQRMFLNVSFSQQYFVVFVDKSEVEKLKTFEYKSYIEPGEVATETVIIKSDVVRNKKLIDYLKPLESQGANTLLTEDFVVCEKGDEVDSKQASILKILGNRIVSRPLNILEIRLSKDMVKNQI